MATHSLIREPYLACYICGQSWRAADQACDCSEPRSRCCHAPLYADSRGPGAPYETSVYAAVLVFALGASTALAANFALPTLLAAVHRLW